MRLDAGALLKRFYFLEQALVRSCAAWIPSVHRIEAKALLARVGWETALTANAMRERVFELRFPSRLMEIGSDAPLVTLYRGSVNAPSSVAFLDGLSTVYLPALRDAERAYLELSDELADGPTSRFLRLSVEEKTQAVADLVSALEWERADAPRGDSAADSAWVVAVRGALAYAGGLGLRDVAPVEVDEVLPPGVPYAVPDDPARDSRYFSCSFYWPDTLDPEYGYGSGVRLQLRSAVSHLNEVWAVEVAGAALFELSDDLGWEFMVDAARWTYDEARHMTMGQRRISAWGLAPEDVPLGRYIYDASAAGGDPIFRIGMLGFFETKNIGKKKARAREFGAMGDELSQRDMQFDWADETIHAEYGRRWLKRLLELKGRPADDYAEVLEECETLVSQRIEQMEPGELDAIRECAERLVSQSERLAASE
jgi:hypothetical protein